MIPCCDGEKCTHCCQALEANRTSPARRARVGSPSFCVPQAHNDGCVCVLFCLFVLTDFPEIPEVLLTRIDEPMLRRGEVHTLLPETRLTMARTKHSSRKASHQPSPALEANRTSPALSREPCSYRNSFCAQQAHNDECVCSQTLPRFSSLE